MQFVIAQFDQGLLIIKNNCFAGVCISLEVIYIGIYHYYIFVVDMKIHFIRLWLYNCDIIIVDPRATFS